MNNVIEITAAAQDQISTILQAHPGQVLVLGVNNKGCSGHSYTFDLQPDDQLHALDTQLTVGPYKVAVQYHSLLKLIGSTLDYQVDQFGARFVWHNPAVKNTCGCGTSVGF